MNTLRQLRNIWTPCVTTIVLACSINAVAQQRYKITDLGMNKSDDNSAWSWGSITRGGRRRWMGS
jgi:hypothetical protein